jgi:hypothetical protein
MPLSVPLRRRQSKSLLQLIPHMTPLDDDEKGLYRLVLEHCDFGIHNMSIDGLPLVTSVYDSDWETGCIVPAKLSDPLMTMEVDLAINEDADPSFTRVSDDATPTDLEKYTTWAEQYFTVRTCLFLFLSWK